MNTTYNDIISIDRSKTKKRFVRSLEYELIASLAFQQYGSKEGARFETLLSIPLKERIPGLINEYGLTRMHRLVRTMLQEFCFATGLPKSRKLTETKASFCACDLMLAAEEDQLSIEDLIVFFALAKAGRWGKFKDVLTHYEIMEKLEGFRQERHAAWLVLQEQREAEVKLLGPTERISPEPTVIKQLFEQAVAKIIPFRKIS